MPKIFKKIKNAVNKNSIKSTQEKNAGDSKARRAVGGRISDPGWRKYLFSDVSFEDIIKYWNYLFPSHIKDENIPEKIRKKLKSHQKNTGIYLWVHGYEPLRCVGVGSNGVVWICKNSANGEFVVKVTCDSKMFGLIKVAASEDEISNCERLEEIINKDENKASKYLIVAKHDLRLGENTSKKRAVFISDLADKGDLEHYESKKEYYDRFIEILETGINVLKGLKILHDEGYSHNDVKPDNLLAITEKSDMAVSQANKSEDQERVVVKVADFGCITKIDSKLNQKLFANRYFCPPDMQNIREDAVAKRDVYSLGVVLLYLLIGCSKSKAKDWAKKLEKSRELYDFCNEVAGKNLLVRYGAFAEPKKAEKFIEFLKVIQQMVASSYSKRLSVDDSFRYMRNVSLMSDG